MRGGVTRRDDERQTTREDRATQPLGCWKAEFRNLFVLRKTIRTNIRIYSYQKIDTNKYMNIFLSETNRKYSNIRIYLYQIIVPTNI